jgi:hypothetical protein
VKKGKVAVNDRFSDNATQGLDKNQKKIVYALVGVAAAYYLWGWHKEHVLQYWPFAIFLLCPLMHLFMHGGHGGHGHVHGHGSREEKD